jgi:hypothetical protein
MRYFLSRSQPASSKILLIESGSRSLIEGLLPHLRSVWQDPPIDLVTCYGGVPDGLAPDAKVYRVTDCNCPEDRRRLIRTICEGNYGLTGIICSGEPIMTRWKWIIAARVPAKVFVLNENGDYFWLNRTQSGSIRQFCMARMGLTGAAGIRTIGRILIFPFSLAFLVIYAISAHSGRIMRSVFEPTKL